MNKPISFEGKVFIEWLDSDSDQWEILNNICDQYGFMKDYDCGSTFCFTSDTIYETLESRIIFFSRRLKDAKIEILSQYIKALVFNSKIHGELK